MNKINKFINISTCVIILAVTACSDDLPVREPSFVPDANAVQAYFPSDNESDLKVPIDATEVTVKLKRVNTSSAASIKLAYTDTANVFTAPATVEFEAGNEEAEITIAFANLSYFGKYNLGIELDEIATNPYVDNGGTTGFELYVTQTDWSAYATGTYYSWWFDENSSQVLEYSAILEKYRFPNLTADGYHYEFTWDGGETIVPTQEKIETGIVHDKYGMVSTTTNEDLSSYVAATKTFTIFKKWTVSAGSFGEGEDIFVMD